MKQHRVVDCVADFYPPGSPNECDIIQTILKSFWCLSFENSSDNSDNLLVTVAVTPIISAWPSGVSERNDNSKSLAGGKSNASNDRSSRLNIDRKSIAGLYKSSVEFIDILQCWLDPDVTFWSTDVWIG